MSEKITRTRLRIDLVDKLKEIHNKCNSYNVQELIEREKEISTETILLHYDVLGLDVKEYFFLEKNAIFYNLTTILGKKHDSSSFHKSELRNRIIEGWTYLLRSGIKAIFMFFNFINYQLSREDFINEEIELDNTIFPILTITPAKYILIHLDTSENIESIELQTIETSFNMFETQAKISGDSGISVYSGEDLNSLSLKKDRYDKEEQIH